MVPPRKANSRRPVDRQLIEVEVEVGDDGVDRHPGVLHRQGVGRRPQGRFAHVEGHEPGQPAGGLHGVEQDPGLVAGAGAQFDQGVGLGPLGDVLGVGVEDGPFGPGRVVLRQPGDLVEQPAAPVVVEVDGRDGLGCRQSDRCARPAPWPAVGRRAKGGHRWWAVGRSWSCAGIPRWSDGLSGAEWGRRRLTVLPAGSVVAGQPQAGEGPAGRAAGRSCGRRTGRGPAGSRTSRRAGRTG